MRCFYIPRRKGTKLFAHLQILSNFESRILNYEVEKGKVQGKYWKFENDRGKSVSRLAKPPGLTRIHLQSPWRMDLPSLLKMIPHTAFTAQRVRTELVSQPCCWGL